MCALVYTSPLARPLLSSHLLAQPCASGTYVNGVGTCRDCPPGSTSPSAAISCSTCPAGHKSYPSSTVNMAITSHDCIVSIVAVMGDKIVQAARTTFLSSDSFPLILPFHRSLALREPMP